MAVLWREDWTSLQQTSYSTQTRSATWGDQPQAAAASNAQLFFLRARPDTSIITCRHNKQVLVSMMSNTGQQNLSNHREVYLSLLPCSSTTRSKPKHTMKWQEGSMPAGLILF